MAHKLMSVAFAIVALLAMALPAYAQQSDEIVAFCDIPNHGRVPALLLEGSNYIRVQDEPRGNSPLEWMKWDGAHCELHFPRPVEGTIDSSSGRVFADSPQASPPGRRIQFTAANLGIDYGPGDGSAGFTMLLKYGQLNDPVLMMSAGGGQQTYAAPPPPVIASAPAPAPQQAPPPPPVQQPEPIIISSPPPAPEPQPEDGGYTPPPTTKRVVGTPSVPGQQIWAYCTAGDTIYYGKWDQTKRRVYFDEVIGEIKDRNTRMEVTFYVHVNINSIVETSPTNITLSANSDWSKSFPRVEKDSGAGIAIQGR